MGKREIEMFLSHLANKENVAASTQHQALNAIIFLYKQVLDLSIEESIEHRRSKRHQSPPVVMTKSKNSACNTKYGTHLTIAKLLYGSGLRLMECIGFKIWILKKILFMLEPEKAIKIVLLYSLNQFNLN